MDEATGPYVKVSLMHEMAMTDEDGYTAMPMAIESWPPGLDVERLLRYVLKALEDEDGDDGRENPGDVGRGSETPPLWP